jgi:hypothetical protein
VIPEPGKWIVLPADRYGNVRRVLPAWHVYTGTRAACLLICPTWITEINRLEGFVKYRTPNEPLDVERTAPFGEFFSTVEKAAARVAELLPPLAEIPDNVLADAQPSTTDAN